MHALTSNEGFTLIELLVVIAIIGILAASALPQVMSAICDARVSSKQGDMSTIQTAATQCQMDKDCTFNDLATWNDYLPERITSSDAGANWSITTDGSKLTAVRVDNVGCTWEDEFNSSGSAMNYDVQSGEFHAE